MFSVSVVAKELTTISQSLKDIDPQERICISHRNGQIECERRFAFWQWLPSFLFCLFPADYKNENSETIAYFHRVFGQKRVERISDRYHIGLIEKMNKGLAVTRHDIERLFVGIGDVRKDDVDDLFQEIKSDSKVIRGLSEEETKHLREEFRSTHKIEMMSKEKMDRLFNILVPFASVEDIFLQNIPRIGRYSDRSESWHGRRNRVFLHEDMRRRAEGQDPLFWEVRVGKRILEESLPEGLMLYHPNGYYECRGLIENHGAYKLLFNPVTMKSGFFRPLIGYLSTRAHTYTWNSLHSRLEGFWKEIASQGTEKTYDATRAVLTDPKLGFVDDAKEKVWLLGMSMGGAQAERDTCLFMDRISKATFLCNPGIDRKTTEMFAEASKNLSSPISLQYIAEVDDIVPRIGEAHIGLGCDPEKVHIAYTMLAPLIDERSSWTVPPILRVPSSILAAAYELFIESLAKNHSRDTTGRPHRKWTLHNFLPVDRQRIELNLDNHSLGPNVLEEYRKEMVFQREEDFPSFWRQALLRV
jgi:pimeloyl-ACP methyl ester carboxylesterase